MSMLKRILALDGVMAACQFRDDGEYIEGYGVMEEEQMMGLAKFAHDYKRMVHGNTDQFSMFTDLPGWAPPRGWHRARRGPGYPPASTHNQRISPFLSIG